MVHTLPHPSPLSGIDPKRIAGNTLVIVVHALAFALLLAPTSWSPPEPRESRIDITWEEARPLPPPPPPPPPPDDPLPVRPQTQPTPTPAQQTVVDAPPVDTAPVFETGEIFAEPTEDVGPPVDTFASGPQAAALEYVANPAPRYPPRSIRDGDEGRVLLRVFVDASGRPVDVQIEQSSGHRELDRAARDKVLADWRFKPAMRGGVPVPAVGLVPIDFTLPRR